MRRWARQVELRMQEAICDTKNEAEDLQVCVELVERSQIATLVLHRAQVERLRQPAHGRDALFCEVTLCRVVQHVMHIFPELQPHPQFPVFRLHVTRPVKLGRSSICGTVLPLVAHTRNLCE